MKIDQRVLPKKLNDILYANDFKCKNLFNKNTMPLNKGLWAGTSGISTNSAGWYVVIPITGGLSYTISKKNSGSPFAFIITTTATVPASGVASVDAAVNAGAASTQYTFSTSSSANYLFLGLAGAGSLTDEQKSQAIEELQVEIGSTKTPYTPYKNFDNTECVLWTNPTPNASFAVQNITLSDAIENYSKYEVIYRIYYNSTGVATTGKLPIAITTLFCNDQYNRGRNVTTLSGTTLRFGDAYYYGTYGNANVTTNNNYIIPIQVIGYK